MFNGIHWNSKTHELFNCVIWMLHRKRVQDFGERETEKKNFHEVGPHVIFPQISNGLSHSI